MDICLFLVPDTSKEIRFDDSMLLLIEWDRSTLKLKDIKGEIEF